MQAIPGYLPRKPKTHTDMIRFCIWRKKFTESNSPSVEIDCFRLKIEGVFFNTKYINHRHAKNNPYSIWIPAYPG